MIDESFVASSHAMINSEINQITSGEETEAPLQLPPPAEGVDVTHKLKLGETLKLEHLGPIIINSDGTTRRIENWDKLTSAEQKNTWRLISARNQKRIEALKRELEEQKALEEDERNALSGDEEVQQ